MSIFCFLDMGYRFDLSSFYFDLLVISQLTKGSIQANKVSRCNYDVRI